MNKYVADRNNVLLNTIVLDPESKRLIADWHYLDNMKYLMDSSWQFKELDKYNRMDSNLNGERVLKKALKRVVKAHIKILMKNKQRLTYKVNPEYKEFVDRELNEYITAIYNSRDAAILHYRMTGITSAFYYL